MWSKEPTITTDMYGMVRPKFWEIQRSSSGIFIVNFPQINFPEKSSLVSKVYGMCLPQWFRSQKQFLGRLVRHPMVS